MQSISGLLEMKVDKMVSKSKTILESTGWTSLDGNDFIRLIIPYILFLRQFEVPFLAQVVQCSTDHHNLRSFTWVDPDFTVKNVEPSLQLPNPSFHHTSCAFVGSAMMLSIIVIAAPVIVIVKSIPLVLSSGTVQYSTEPNPLN